MDFTYCYTNNQYKEWVDRLSEHECLAGDSETYTLPEWRGKGGSALDPHTGRMSLLILKPRALQPVIFDIIQLERDDYDPQLMHDLLISRDELLFHYAQFDLKFIKRHYGVILNNARCTQQQAKLIHNAMGSKFGRMTGASLKDLCRDYLNIKITGKGEEQVTDWYPRPLKDATYQQEQEWYNKLVYAAGDVMYLHDLEDFMLPIICNPMPASEIIPDGSYEPPYGLGMERVLDLEMKMVSVAAAIEYNGLPASKEIFEQIQTAIWNPEYMEGRLLEVASDLCGIFKLDTYPSAWHEFDMPADHSLKILNNPTKLRDLINKQIGLRLETSQGAVLDRLLDLLGQVEAAGSAIFVDENEEDLYREINELEQSVAVEASDLCKKIVEYKKLKKQHSIDLGAYVNPATGCIHATIKILGASSGRTASAYPNLQQVAGRTYLQIQRQANNLFSSSANLSALIPDWSPNRNAVCPLQN